MDRGIIGEPVEITRCATRVPYGLAEFLAYLANLKFTLTKNENEILIPTFLNYRSINMKSANFKQLIGEETFGFCFFGDITAISLKNLKNDEIAKRVKERYHAIVIGSKKDNLAQIRLILKAMLQYPKDCLPREGHCRENKTKNCVSLSSEICFKRRLCPITISRRHLLFLENLKRRIPHDFKEHCLCNCLRKKVNCPWEKEASQIDTNSYAQIAICGYGGERYGSLARAINLLLFRENVEIRDKNQKYAIDEKSERCFGCFHPYRNYYKFYGNIAEFKEKDVEKIRNHSFINAVLIRPAQEKGFETWQKYAQELVRELNPLWENEYRLFISNNRKIIFLFRSPKKSCYLSKIKEKINECWEYRRKKFKSKISDKPDYTDPDLFLFALRGYRHRENPIHQGICTERETTCPFEKIMDETRTYQVDWQELFLNP